jgi:hypothetical protein
MKEPLRDICDMSKGTTSAGLALGKPNEPTLLSAKYVA